MNSTYYEVFNDNYGFAHFIAKYLNTLYPPLGIDTQKAYQLNINSDSNPYDIPRSLKEPISIMNYFLCDNTGNKLRGNIDLERGVYEDPIYTKIYGEYKNRKYIINTSDLPILCQISPDDEFFDKSQLQLGYINNKDFQNIYTLEPWGIPKQVCELDNFVMSYLLGRTITPNSSREDIYYVQKLLLGDVEPKYKGRWLDSYGNDLTNVIINYQKSCVNNNNNIPLFVTGYFDIFTESVLLEGKGEQSRGIYGL